MGYATTPPRPTESKGRRGPIIVIVCLAVTALIAAVVVTWRVIGGEDGPDDDGTDPSGAQSEPTEGRELQDLARQVAQHGDPSFGIIITDLAAARADLDLPADTDPSASSGAAAGSGDDPQRHLRMLLPPLPHLATVPMEGSPAESIDLSKAAAIVTTSGSRTGSLVLIRTAQDPESIAQAYLATGQYQRDGDALLLTGPTAGPVPGVYTAIAWNDDLIALSVDPESDALSITAALEPAEQGDPLSDIAVEVISSTAAPSVHAMLLGGAPPCADAMVAAASFDNAGSLYLRATGEPEEIQPADVGPGSITFADPVVDAGWVQLEAEGSDPYISLPAMLPESTWVQLYSCG